MITIQDLLDELDQEAQITLRVLERAPADKFDWRPHSKSMALGQLSLHLASTLGTVAELATRSTMDVDTQIPLPSTANVDQLLSAHDRSVAKSQTTPRRNGRCNVVGPVANGARRAGNHDHFTQGIIAVDHAESQLSSPRPANRLFASGRRTHPGDIRCQRG